MVRHLTVSQLCGDYAEQPEDDRARFAEVNLDKPGLGVAPMPAFMRPLP